MSNRLENYIRSISSAASVEVQQKLESIEMKDQFRAPELRDQSWIEVVYLLQSLPVTEFASMIKAQAVEVCFTTEELHAVGRALGSHKKDIERAMISEKIDASEKEQVRQWEQDRKSAHEKVMTYIFEYDDGE